jgi:hypothetical protein
MPQAWLATGDAVLAGLATEGATRLPRPRIVHCQSCSVSLLDEHNAGVSDRYCRYCADEQGQLKPRDEVRRLIARWMGHWQGNLSEEEAMRRADAFMSVMPAWSNN